MELSKENQDLLLGFPHFYAVDSNMPMLAKHHVEKILIQKQQKIEELEKENAKLKGDFSFNSCDHKFRAHWAHSKCEKCGAIHLGNSRQDREDYGIAANKTFRNMAEAKFYQANGFLPEDNKQ